MNPLYKTYGDMLDGDTTSSLGDDILSVQSFDHKKKLIRDNFLVVIDVWGAHCAPCKDSMPKFAALARKYNSPGICLLAKEDAGSGLTDTSTIPCFVFYIHGNLQPFHRIDGADLNEIERVIQVVLSKR